MRKRIFAAAMLAAAALTFTACDENSKAIKVEDGSQTNKPKITAAESAQPTVMDSETHSNVPEKTEAEDKAAKEEKKPQTPAEDFTYEENENGEIIITAYKGKKKDVVFPNEIEGKRVVQIGKVNEDGSSDYVTDGSIQSIYVPGSVKAIDNVAFCDCEELYNVTLEEGIERIGPSAFRLCKNLTEIVIPNSLVSIGSDAFSETGIKEINIPNSVKEIGGRAFTDCKDLTEVTFSAGLEIIDNCAFADCEKIASVTFPDSVKKIGLDAFRGCKIKNVTLPDGMTEFDGARTFENCEITFKGAVYTPNEYDDLYTAINGHPYEAPSGIPPAA